MSDLDDELREMFSITGGLGHKTLREHGAVCRNGQTISLDATGDEVCTGVPMDSLPSIILVDQEPDFVGRGRHTHHERMAVVGQQAPKKGGHSGTDPSFDPSALQRFDQLMDAAAYWYAKNDQQTGDWQISSARDIWDSSPYVQGQRSRPEPLAQASAQARVTDDAVIKAASRPSEPSFSEVSAETGVMGALFYPFFRMEQEALPPSVQPLHSGTEAAAAEGRALGLPGMDPLSGRDLTTKPPLPPPQSSKAVAIGAGIGAGLGGLGLGVATRSPSGAIGGAALGGLLGALLGYATDKTVRA